MIKQSAVYVIYYKQQQQKMFDVFVIIVQMPVGKILILSR